MCRCIEPEVPSLPCTLSTQIMDPAEIARWSQLTIFVGEVTVHYAGMKAKQKQALAVRCPTCGAKPGEKCELSTGLPRTEPHRDRRLAASEQ